MSRSRVKRAVGGAGVLLAMVGAAGPAGAQEVGIPVGTRVEAVVVEDLDGEPLDLGRIIGEKPVLLEFWATWCPLCEELQPRIDAAHARYGDRVEFVTVAVAVNQSPRRIKRHLERHPIPGLVVWDAGGRAARAFHAPGTAYVVVLDAEGRVRYTGAGGDQDIAAALAKVVE